MVKLLTGLSAKQADLIILILTSQHIENHVRQENNRFDIQVHPSDRDSALSVIEAYYKENKFFRLKQQIQKLPVSSFKSYTAFGIMGLLCVIHAASVDSGLQENIILKYGASALFIFQGETYRAVTALFLHADARHLLGNIAGVLIFCAPVITLSGFGTGPFILLFSGTLGNLINAYFHHTAHLSIGASTAVMGAAGLLVAFQITQKGQSVRLNNLMPVIAGTVLMAMFSQGENTDVWAHIFGFLSGIGSGIIFFPLDRTLQFPKKNLIALLITIAIILASLLAAG